MLGPLMFLIMIDDLNPGLMTHKYMNDTAVSEIVQKRHVGPIQSAVGELATWSIVNKMNVDIRKTKGLILDPQLRNAPPQLTIDNLTLDIVTHFKLLGVIVSQSLKWNDRVANVCTRLNVRLHFLRQLQRAGMSTGDLICFYKFLVRVVAQYVCPVWHSSLTVEQSYRIELIRRRALKIIFNDFTSGDSAYVYNCMRADLPQFAERRDQLTRRFFAMMTNTDNCLTYLLPIKCFSQTTLKTRLCTSNSSCYIVQYYCIRRVSPVSEYT